MKLEEFQQLGKNVKGVIRKFTENPGKFASIVLQMYWDCEKECDAYKQQRDELIKDIAKLRKRNVELERKAQAFYKVIKLKDDIKFIKDVSLSHATEEPVNQEMYWVHSLMDSLLEGLEDE